MAVFGHIDEGYTSPEWEEHDEEYVRQKYKCPCCGYYTLDDFYGSFDICPVCFWEDDGLQFENPIMDGGANSVSLIRARICFKSIGASEERLKENVRTPLQAELQGIDYESPKGWYDEANDVLYIRQYRPSEKGLRSYVEELNWRKECFLYIKGTDSPRKTKPITFSETIKKRSSYEIKKAIFSKLVDSDFSFIQDRLNMNAEKLQYLSDDEMRDFWDTISRMADLEGNRIAADLRERLQCWAEPCWDIPDWMEEW